MINTTEHHSTVSLTYFEALRQQLLSEQRRVFSSWYAPQQWALATASLPDDARRWKKAPDAVRTGNLLARFRNEGRIVATEHSPSIYVLQDPSLPSNEPTAHELLSAIHPNAVLSYESALRAHQLKIGRASCRERGEIPVVGAVLNKEDVRRRHERDRR